MFNDLQTPEQHTRVLMQHVKRAQSSWGSPGKASGEKMRLSSDLGDLVSWRFWSFRTIQHRADSNKDAGSPGWVEEEEAKPSPRGLQLYVYKEENVGKGIRGRRNRICKGMTQTSRLGNSELSWLNHEGRGEREG